MTGQAITFREMFAPISAEEFFERYQDRTPLHVKGATDKFSPVFSWADLNTLLNMPNVWTSQTIKVILDGNVLADEQFCRPAYGREGQAVLQPDPDRLRHFLREGATIVLDFAESLSPSIASVSAALQVWFGGPVTCNIYCSWQAHPGFGSHFDATDVIVMQVVGRKNWRVYEGRFEHPIEAPSYETTGYAQEQHEQWKGAELMSVEMQPGDLLYLPRGQYHDALATSEASLHLTFGVTQATGQDVLMQLTETFIDDPLFRKPLPSFDDEAAHAAHIAQLADHMRAVIADTGASDAIRGFQYSRAFMCCYPQYFLPDRTDPMIFRVQSLGASVVPQDGGYMLVTPHGKAPLDQPAAALAEWAMTRDYFSDRELSAAAEEL
ncbi:MAG: cupin domain-containing protein, partial [Pseudomonadota bacterium]